MTLINYSLTVPQVYHWLAFQTKQHLIQISLIDYYRVQNIKVLYPVWPMKSHQLLSDKDLQILKVTYRTVIENYYENSSEQNATQFLLLNALTMQTISTRDQSQSLLLVSMLQVFKVKAKSNKELSDSVQNTIIHLKNPLKIYLKDSTIQECLQKMSLYQLTCLVISRFYEHEMKPKVDTYNWKEIIIRVSKNCDKNMPVALETMIILLQNYSMHAKEVSKSGMIKYICSVYIPQVLEDKINLYRSLKVIKMVARNDRSVLPSREKNIALVMYNHPAYILIVQEIQQICYDVDYSMKVLNNPKDIDPLYVWSYNTNFCSQSSQRTVDDLQQMLKEGGKGIPADLQWKIYSTLNNLIKVKNVKISESWRIPMNAQKNLNAYLKLVISMIEKNPNQFQKVDIKAIEYVNDKSKTSDIVTAKLIKDLKNLDPSLGNKKIGKLEASLLQQYSIQKNPEMLMERAAKVPRNNQDLKVTEQILGLPRRAANEFQDDTIKTLKNKAIDSLKAAIVNKYPINFANVFNNLNLDMVDPETINRLLKLGQLHLTMDPDAVDKYNAKKFLDILQWLQNNQADKIIDWVAASQMLAIIFGPDEWKKHLNQIPKRCFWLLNASDSELNGNLMQIINSLPLNHPKLPIILGFISKTGDEQLKKLLMKSKALEETINQICNYKNNRSSVKSYISKPDQDISDGQQMKKYLINVLNMSHFIYLWDKSPISKEIEGKIIKPCLQNIIKCFHGAEHEFRFIQNCLPYKLNLNNLKDMNVERLLETHGRLTSYLHNNKYEGRLDFNKIATVPSQQDPEKVEQIVKFLKDNPDMIDGHDLYALLDGLMKNAKKEHKYWKYYPHYMGIINNILNIATKSNNPEVLQKITDFLQKIISGTAENDDITPDELDELYENLYEGLDKLAKRNVKIDTNRVKMEAQKIKNDEWKKKIIEKLKLMNEIKKNNPETTRVSLGSETSKIDTYAGNKYQSIPVNLQEGSRLTTSRSANGNLQDSKIKISNINEPQQKKDENMFQGNIDTNQIIKNQEANMPTQTPEQKRLLDALKILKKIIKKQEPKETFPKLVDIFMVSQFNQKRRYVLGHLLTQYFQIIEKDKRCLTLLQMSDKTNLNKTVCYNFLSKFQQAFLISKRWKLIGYEFMDLAMERTKCRNENKIPCVENGCQITEYNLVKQGDISYFQSKNYQTLTAQLYPKIEDKAQAIYYLILVGSSARLLDIKTFYISNKLHTLLLDYVHKDNWISDQKISSNIAYALSSLVYTQNHIAVEVASKKNQMIKLMNSFRQFSTVKIVIDASCSMLSNLCYSSKQTKQILHGYGLPDLLLEYMRKNLAKPEVSTYKQIMRTLGNISLHKPSAQKLIDGGICAMVVEMVEKFNILIYRDDEKLKLLKLTVDFISNLSTQKYKLETLHADGITNFVITILETTQISQDQILMGCIDTIDGLCQSQQIQNYVVMDKKLLLQLIDLLKIKEDQRLITKSIRLLTNMTLNQTCIPYILQANLLSVLANIVLSVYRNEKIELYINKIILRIFGRKPDIKLILKSGYLDCLLKGIQISNKVDDNYIDILLHYCQYIPNYLNHRAFFNLVKMLTTKQNQKQVVEKCLKVFRAIFSSEQRQDDDVLVQGSTIMYEKLLQNNQVNRLDIVYLIGLHCTKSRKFKAQLQAEHQSKKGFLLDYIQKMTQQEAIKELAYSALFAILNGEKGLLDVGKQIAKQEDFAYKLLTKGFECKLFRMDGSSKSAIVDINEMYMIRAYKYPDGEIKKKYVISVRQLRDWQFMFEPQDQVWKNSVFSKTKGVFETLPKIQNCVTLLGSQQWGQFSLINLEFVEIATKLVFVKAISALVLAFKSS